MPLQVFGTPAPRKKSFGAHFSGGVNALIRGAAAGYDKAKQLEAQKQEDAFLSKVLGFDVTGVSHDLRKIALQENLREQSKVNAAELKGESTQKSLNNLKNIYSDPNLSNEEKIFSTYQEFYQNPTFAKNLLSSIGEKQKAEGEEIAADQFAEGYESILEGDTQKLQQILSNPKVPLKIKTKLADLRDRQEIRKSVDARELRSRQSMVQKAYQRGINNLQIQMKSAHKDERKVLQEKISKLEALEKVDLNKLAKDPNAYHKLKIWKTDAGPLLEEESSQEEQKSYVDEILNNLTDEQIHQLIIESGGDIDKAKEIALQRYLQ